MKNCNCCSSARILDWSRSPLHYVCDDHDACDHDDGDAGHDDDDDEGGDDDDGDDDGDDDAFT